MKGTVTRVKMRVIRRVSRRVRRGMIRRRGKRSEDSAERER